MYFQIREPVALDTLSLSDANNVFGVSERIVAVHL